MEIQDLFDVAVSVSLAGTENEHQLCRTFFMRSGRRASFQTLMSVYGRMEHIVRERGYSDPLDYLKDFFPGENYECMKVFRDSLDLDVKVEIGSKRSEETEVQDDAAAQRTGVSGPEETRVPIKIKIDGRRKDDKVAIEIPPRDRAKILRYKKTSKKYREMDQREKDADNMYDYFVSRARVDETGSMFVDNRCVLDENPFMHQFFGDLDIGFRNVMLKVYRHSRTRMKDKSRYGKDMEFLEEYFDKKLQISRDEEGSGMKLANAIAYLMRKLQHKIFETEDPEIVESMHYLKTKLCSFYNFYRK